MGGAVELVKSAGCGSLFRFTLINVGVIVNSTQNYLASREIKTPFINETPQQPLKGFRLLVVDDDELNQTLAKAFLSRGGAIVEQAYNGVEAIEAIQAQGLSHFSAVLMDVQMPKMNGIDATRRIRTLEDSFDLPIIGLTAYIQQSEVEEMIKAGMNHHISKPVNFRELIVFLESYLLN
jgi:CheY-like chemotaxis protein